ITTMNAVNAVQLFILLWTFTAVCQAKNFNVSCDDVTGFVGKKVNLTCRVSQQCDKYCLKMYKFKYPNDTAICKQEPPVDSCDESKSFTCSYTPTTPMTEKFRFFAQANCDMDTKEFTVNIAEEALNKKLSGTSLYTTLSSRSRIKASAVAAIVGCFILIILILITMTIIHNKKPNFIKSCGFQKRMFLCIKHEENNSHHPEDVI
ncbi:hypothetical protein cypCar_00040313, partial [Cyprinus carpio]